MEVQSLACPLWEGRCWWLKGRGNSPRKLSPRTPPSSGRTHPSPPSGRAAPPSSGERLTATSVFGGAPRGGISPSDPLLPSRALLAILRLQPSTDCSSTSGYALGSAVRSTYSAPAGGGRGTRAWPAQPSCGLRRKRGPAAQSAEFCTSSSSESSRKKPYLRPTSIQCYLCLLLNSHFLTEAGIHVFILGCISVSGLPKTEANWQYVISDLKRIQDLIQSTHMDANLYTESNAHPGCKVTAMKCFLLELHVILHESRNSDINDTVQNLIILANSSLSSIETLKRMEVKKHT
nr:interleukin-15 isoform X2 [Kogia breviceps]